MITKTVAVFPGDDASPEVMIPTVALLEKLQLPIEFVYPMVGDAALSEHGARFPDASKAQVDEADATFFGSTSGQSTEALFYLRWGKQTYANVRPCQFRPGYRSPMANPDNIDFVVVRENLEDLYLGLEGNLEDLAFLNLYSKHAKESVKDMGLGRYAIKVITESGSERVIRFAFELARKRGGQRKVTLTSKYNMLAKADGYFRDIGYAIAKEYPDIRFETFIVDDFLCRMITNPCALDVVVMPNLYGDIMSDGAAGLIGGLGLAPSGCYGADYAYFESAHGTAPDIQGQNIINPTATLLSASMMLSYLGLDDAANTLEAGISSLYAAGECIPVDQGGTAKTNAFFQALDGALGLT